MKISEENIVEQLGLRNEQALSFIIQHYGGLLVAIMKRHVHLDHQAIEECLDDVLIAIWNHSDSFDAQRNSFKQWIAAIAKHRSIDYQRRMMKRQQRFVSLEMNEHHMPRQDLDSTYEDNVEEVLEQLNEVERKIFQQYYLEGFPTREIAQRLNVKESWIQNKLSRGRKKIRQLLNVKS